MSGSLLWPAPGWGWNRFTCSLTPSVWRRRPSNRENASLSARISPQITELAQQYLAYLTSDSYIEIKLDSSLRARTAGDDGTLLDALRLSSGTRDQLYFALRLAVCQVLSHQESIPLLLDDPFLTWDNKRMERGLRLLQTLSKGRQVILLTCRQAGRLAIPQKEV